MAQPQRSYFIAIGNLISLLALSTSPIHAAETSPTLPHTRAAGPSFTCPVPPDAKRNALWNLVECCTQNKSSDTHCIYTNETYKYIVAKDASPSKTKAYLIIPTIQMIGIESSLTLDPPTVDIWQDGWTEARNYPGYPESRTGLAINSAISRNQDQLHIHMSCVNPSVLTLLDNLKEISSDPSKPTLIQITLNKSGNRVSQHNYEAVLLKSLAGDSSPFKVMRLLPHASEHVKDQSFAIVKGRGAQSNNYILLNTYASGSNPGEAEELLDQTCSH